MTASMDQLVAGLEKQNGAALGHVIGRGNVAAAEEKPDGTMHGQIRIPVDRMSWDPAVLVLPHGGDLELDIINDDLNTHGAILPSNGHSKFIWLPCMSKGTAMLNLDGPGYYWYGSPTGNDEGRGLTGVICVLGDVPADARLDRPAQPRP